MHNQLSRPVAAAMTEARLRAARGRGRRPAAVARPPGRPVRRSAATAAARVARRLDAEAARRTLTV